MTLRNAVRVAAIAALLSGCGGALEYEAISSPKAPGADAEIEANVHEDRHVTDLELEVEHLPPASRIDPTSTHYVAWYRRNDQETWTRIAALKYEEKSREGKLESSVPETAFELAVTTESQPDAVTPSPNVVFSQRVGG